MTRLDRIEPQLNNVNPGDDRDTTTAASMCMNMERLLLGNVLSPSSRRQLETWLQHNEIGASMIRAAVPKNWTVGDKTGRCGNGATNDIAIVRAMDRVPVLIAIYFAGSSEKANDRDAAIAEAARMVVESLSGDSK